MKYITMSEFTKSKSCVFVLVLVALSSAAVGQEEDEFSNGKLTSGQVYDGHKYHHILVDAKVAEESNASPASTRLTGDGETSDQGTFEWFTSSRGGGCYRLVRTRTRIARQFIQKLVHTGDRAGCESQCARSKDFTCRGFNFRYKRQGPSDIAENCELSVQDTYDADLDDERTFHVSPNFDFYERTKLGRDCNGRLLPPNHLDDPKPPTTTTPRTRLTDSDLHQVWPLTPKESVSPSSIWPSGPISGVDQSAHPWLSDRNRGNSQANRISGSTGVSSNRRKPIQTSLNNNIQRNTNTGVVSSSSFSSVGRIDSRLNEVSHGRNRRPFASEPVKHGATMNRLSDIDQTTGRPLPIGTSIGTTSTFNSNVLTSTAITSPDSGTNNHLITSNTETVSSNAAVITPAAGSSTYTTDSNTVITRRPINRNRKTTWSTASNIGPFGVTARPKIRFHRVDRRNHDRNALNNSNRNSSVGNKRTNNKNSNINNNVSNNDRLHDRFRNREVTPTTSNRKLNNRPNNRHGNRQNNQHLIITSVENKLDVSISSRGNSGSGTPSLPRNIFDFPSRNQGQKNDLKPVVFHRVPNRSGSEDTNGLGSNGLVDTSQASIRNSDTRASGNKNRHYWITPDNNVQDNNDQYMWITASNILQNPVNTLDSNSNNFDTRQNANRNKFNPSVTFPQNTISDATRRRFKPTTEASTRTRPNDMYNDIGNIITRDGIVNTHRGTGGVNFDRFNGYGRPLANASSSTTLKNSNSGNNRANVANNRLNNNRNNNLFTTNLDDRGLHRQNNINSYGSGGAYRGSASGGTNNNHNKFRRVRPVSPTKNDGSVDSQSRHNSLLVQPNFPNIAYNFPGNSRRNRTGVQGITGLSSVSNISPVRPVYTTARPSDQYLPPSSNNFNHIQASRPGNINNQNVNNPIKFRPNIVNNPNKFKPSDQNKFRPSNVNNPNKFRPVDTPKPGNVNNLNLFRPPTVNNNQGSYHTSVTHSQGSRPQDNIINTYDQYKPISNCNSHFKCAVDDTPSNQQLGSTSGSISGAGSNNQFLGSSSGSNQFLDSSTTSGSLDGGNSDNSFNTHINNHFASSSNNGGSGTFSNDDGGSYREECFPVARANTKIDMRVVREKQRVFDVHECKRRCHRERSYVCKTFAYRYRGSSWHGENCFLSELELADISGVLLTGDSSYDVFRRRLHDRECGVTVGNSALAAQQSQPGGKETVSGLKCYGESMCTEDHLGGYWYCETNSAGAWDYCCKPDQICSASQGYAFKWCYVGAAGLDQWRPCTPERQFLLESSENRTRINNRVDRRLSQTFKKTGQTNTGTSFVKPINSNSDRSRQDTSTRGLPTRHPASHKVRPTQRASPNRRTNQKPRGSSTRGPSTRRPSTRKPSTRRPSTRRPSTRGSSTRGGSSTRRVPPNRNPTTRRSSPSTVNSPVTTRSRYSATVFKESISKLYPGTTGPQLQTDGSINSRRGKATSSSSHGSSVTGSTAVPTESKIELLDFPNLG